MDKLQQLVDKFDIFIANNNDNPLFWLGACVLILFVVYVLGGSLKEK